MTIPTGRLGTLYLYLRSTLLAVRVCISETIYRHQMLQRNN